MLTEMSLLKEARIWHYRDKVILSDHQDYEQSDAVFPLCHENIYFVENLDIPERSTVLDICTGSGIIAILAADKAEKVIAVDINPRAIEYAELNAVWNRVADRIDFRTGNLFEPVNGMKFDVITCNPPFEPTPIGYLNYTHSYGGEDGAMILEKIINEVKNYLVPDGSLQMIFYLREDRLDILSSLNNLFNDVSIKELEVISPESYDNYLQRRLSKLNTDSNLTFSGKLPVKYLYIKADGLKNGH